VHLGINAVTLDIWAIEITTNAIGDAPTLPGLLAQIPEDEQILSVGGDGAYDTRACHAAIAEREADAVIPVRRNGRPWTKDGPGVDARNKAARSHHLEKVEWLPSPQSGRDQNALLQAPRSTRGIAHLRSSDYRAQSPYCNPQSVLRNRNPGDRPHRIITSSKRALMLSRHYATKPVRTITVRPKEKGRGLRPDPRSC
jgi:hypothetical protein